jgi:hypothetical protein
MAKYVMVVQTRAKDGRDAEFNDWYDNIHLDEVCAIPGINAARRFETVPTALGLQGMPYLALYEVDTDNPQRVIAELGQRAADGKMNLSETLDAEAAVLWLYKQI